MICWHVERKNVCIYSQLKSCSSPEVAAMLAVRDAATVTGRDERMALMITREIRRR
jgi:TnpA family transposase